MRAAPGRWSAGAAAVFVMTTSEFAHNKSFTAIFTAIPSLPQNYLLHCSSDTDLNRRYKDLFIINIHEYRIFLVSTGFCCDY